MTETIENIDVELGKKLRSLRVQLGKTQSDIAQFLEISPQQYQKYEKGMTKCSITTIYKLAGYYQQSVSSLLPGENGSAGGFKEDPHEFSPDINGEYNDEAAAISELMAIFIRIPSKATRRKLIDLLNEVF